MASAADLHTLLIYQPSAANAAPPRSSLLNTPDSSRRYLLGPFGSPFVPFIHYVSSTQRASPLSRAGPITFAIHYNSLTIHNNHIFQLTSTHSAPWSSTTAIMRFDTSALVLASVASLATAADPAITTAIATATPAAPNAVTQYSLAGTTTFGDIAAKPSASDAAAVVTETTTATAPASAGQSPTTTSTMTVSSSAASSPASPESITTADAGAPSSNSLMVLAPTTSTFATSASARPYDFSSGNSTAPAMGTASAGRPASSTSGGAAGTSPSGAPSSSPGSSVSASSGNSVSVGAGVLLGAAGLSVALLIL